MALLLRIESLLNFFPPPPVGANKNVLRTNAFGECFANVFDDISYGVGINPKDFQLLRSTE